jgi:hypothetical protein
MDGTLPMTAYPLIDKAALEQLRKAMWPGMRALAIVSSSLDSSTHDGYQKINQAGDQFAGELHREAKKLGIFKNPADLEVAEYILTSESFVAGAIIHGIPVNLLSPEHLKEASKLASEISPSPPGHLQSLPNCPAP